MAKPVTAFETEVAEDFEDVALLPDSDQPRQAKQTAPTWRSMLSWLSRDKVHSREGFQALGQADDNGDAEHYRGVQSS